MRQSTFARLGAIITAAACIGTCNAQSSGPSGLSVRIGDVFPSSTQASSLSHNWFSLGADFKLNSLSVSAPGTGLHSYLGISVDYYAQGGDNDVPVALTYNVRTGPMVFSAGIGPDFRNAGDLTDTGVGIGEQLAVAYDFGNMPTPIFIEAKYFFASKPELSGLGLYAGIRF